MSNPVGIDRKPVKIRRLLKVIGIAVVGCGLALAFTLFATGLRFIHKPFQMALFTTKGRTYVQFARPDDEMVSPSFPVRLHIDEDRQFVLDTADIAIPGCTIEFHDITMFPGRYTIRIGETRIDVMQSRINVDGFDHEWTKGRLGANTTAH